MTRAAPTFAEGTPVTEANPLEKKTAQARYNEGAALFSRERFEEALEAFRASHDIVASPNSQLMIARSLAELDRPIEAYVELEAVEKAATAAATTDARYAETAEKARTYREELRARLSVVRLRVVGGGDVESAGIVTIDGTEIPVGEWKDEHVLAPGAHEISGTYFGETRVRTTETLAPGEVRELVVDLRAPHAAGPSPLPPSGPTPPPRSASDGVSLVPFAATAGGVGVAGLVLFAIAGTMNATTYSDLEAQCPGGVCPSNEEAPFDVEARKSEGKTQQTLANVGLIIGLSGLAIGATLLTIEMATSDDTAETSEAPPGRAWVSVGPSSISLHRSF